MTFLLRSSFSLLIFYFTVLTSLAQSGTSSPYSSYGIGELNQGAMARGRGMASTGFAANKANSINFMNPASYASLTLTTFETGVQTRIRNSFTADSSFRMSSAGMAYIAFGFPVAKKWGMSLGVLPYTLSGYNLYSIHSDSALGSIRQQYQSSGGINHLYLGNGFKLSDRFSIGLNASMLFGAIDKIAMLEFTDVPNAWHTRTSTNNSYFGFLPSAGIQFSSNPLKTADSDSLLREKAKLNEVKQKLDGLRDTSNAEKDSLLNSLASIKSNINGILVKHVPGKWKLGIGLVGNPGMKIKMNHAVLAERYKYTGGLFTIEDTTSNTNIKQQVTLPTRIGIGFSLSNGNNWTHGLDVSYTDWSSFEDGSGKATNYSSGLRFSYGMEHISANKKTRKGFFRRINYRAGGFFEQSFFDLNGKPVQEFGASLGFGFPLRKSFSMLNIASAYSFRVMTGTKTYEERWFSLTLGLVINDKWFVRKKFD